MELTDAARIKIAQLNALGGTIYSRMFQMKKWLKAQTGESLTYHEALKLFRPFKAKYRLDSANKKVMRMVCSLGTEAVFSLDENVMSLLIDEDYVATKYIELPLVSESEDFFPTGNTKDYGVFNHFVEYKHRQFRFTVWNFETK